MVTKISPHQDIDIKLIKKSRCRYVQDRNNPKTILGTNFREFDYFVRATKFNYDHNNRFVVLK